MRDHSKNDKFVTIIWSHICCM